MALATYYNWKRVLSATNRLHTRFLTAAADIGYMCMLPRTLSCAARRPELITRLNMIALDVQWLSEVETDM